MGPDGVNNVKIGDFGLATSGQFAVDKQAIGSSSLMESVDMTRSIGTSFYVAPEVRSAVNGIYSSKVDVSLSAPGPCKPTSNVLCLDVFPRNHIL